LRLDFEILYTIESFIRDNERTTIIIDDIKYLTMCNGFEKTISFLKTVNDIASMHNSTIVSPINTLLFDEKELHQIESVFDEIIDTGILPETTAEKDRVIKESYAYLCESPSTDYFYNFIKKTDKPIICVSKTYPSKIKAKHKLEASQIYWLTDTSTDELCFHPDRLDFEMTQDIGTFLRDKRGMVALEGLDVLIYQNDFELVSEFLKGIIDIASENRGNVVVHLDPKSFEEVEVALLEKRFDIIMSGSD
jgi:archaellum biogenesis ATPase FlaH